MLVKERMSHPVITINPDLPMQDALNLMHKEHLRRLLVVDKHWSEWFEGVEVTYCGEAETVLSGPVRDQTALYSILSRLRDLSLPLLSVKTRPIT